MVARIVRVDRALSISRPKEADVSLLMSVFLTDFAVVEHEKHYTDHGTLLRP